MNLCVELQVLPVGLPENSQGEKRRAIASLRHREMAVLRNVLRRQDNPSSLLV